MRRIAVVALAFILAGCSGHSAPSFASRDEIADIAGDACADQIADSDEVRSLKSRLSEAEGEIAALRARADGFERADDILAKAVDDTGRKYNYHLKTMHR